MSTLSHRVHRDELTRLQKLTPERLLRDRGPRLDLEAYQLAYGSLSTTCGDALKLSESLLRELEARDRELAHLNRKGEHGCFEALCPECDPEEWAELQREKGSPAHA